MKNTSSFYTSSLSEMGVTQAADGTLSVDEEKLGETLKEGLVSP